MKQEFNLSAKIIHREIETGVFGAIIDDDKIDVSDVKEFIKLDEEFHEEIVKWACQFNELSTTEDILNWWRKGKLGARKIKNKFNDLIGDELK